MRSNFTLEDIKRIVETLYNGNLAQYKATNGSVEYFNENSEKILLKDEYGKTIGEQDLAQYLNLHFYTWRNRVVDAGKGELLPFDAWIDSLNASMNDAYVLIERTNDQAVSSQDIDGGQITGRATVLIQANKVANLDYYAGKIRNKYLGAPQDIVNSYGDTLKAYLNMGIILYDEEPMETQIGECVIVSFNFTINYLADAVSYSDEDISFSVGIDPDELAENPLGLKYEKLSLTKATLAAIMTYSGVPYAARPDMTGVINTAQGNTWSLSYFDFKTKLNEELDRLFWEAGMLKYSVDGGANWEGKVLDDETNNDAIFVKVKKTYSDGGEVIYKYCFTPTEMRREIVNGDFTVCTIVLRGRAYDETRGQYIIE